MEKSKSLLRRLEYKELSQIEFSGEVLDLGGAGQSDYHRLMKGNCQIKSVNINPQSGPDYLFSLEEKFPLEPETFDWVLCLNVLEHIFNFQNILSESRRILKPGGKLIGAVPFMFNIHPSPNDYFRFTGAALKNIFEQAGLSEIEIKELGSGVFSAVYQLKLGLYKFKIIKMLALRTAQTLDKLIKFLKPTSHLSEKYMPLGYFFIAKKSKRA